MDRYASLIEGAFTWCLFIYVGLNVVGTSILGLQVIFAPYDE